MRQLLDEEKQQATSEGKEMIHLFWKLGLGLSLCLALGVATLLYAPRTEQKRIDCEQVEFHPDYSPKMKEQCRMRSLS